ncbi:hypothetical protein MWN34_10070 [Ancylobacter sp. 6x-1]|uniref:Copper oxidase n=1 Tax=Ancylobacter crimeensis TaxID=2579147 RepID=A0ABT0DBC1_9HYPH|nr:hypothetical protein [Ancylobacter crimeensis]MCK0197258.1 hypothetical protein [Ancylobacter crimeensis]
MVAFEQAYLLNRFGSYVPAGMMFALKSDVVPTDGRARLEPGHVRLRPDKRPRPIVLRANEGDCLDVRFTNLLADAKSEEGGIPRENGGRLPDYAAPLRGTPQDGALARPEKVSVDAPLTRAASFHITGFELVPILDAECPLDAACGGDGGNVGLPAQQGIGFNPATGADVRASFDIGSLAKPGQTVVTRWKAGREGTYFAYSTGAPVGGEGDGGQIGLGLFGAVTVEPEGSKWYRSQVTYDVLQALRGNSGGGHPYGAIDYDRTASIRGRVQPVLGMLDADNRIVATDLNAIVVLDEKHPGQPESAQCTGAAFGNTCQRSFREFTVIFHDEVHAQQAFPELEDEGNPLHSLRDGMGINYGVSSMGSLVMSTPAMRGVWPAKNCPECRAEEFFLSSWANGDPALLLKYDDDDRASGALYPDDPSNVHHSYLGDPVRFRNLHAGPKETHVFHLHAHQWMQDASNPDSSYLDSQTISPGATFSYGIEFGGAGNRNYTPGDSIFHCHLYPHFAQGMWELWRVHDAFDDGRPGFFHADRPVGPGNDPGMMNLPDPEIAEGTQSPALVPIPGSALAPMPTAAFRGYPFYIPGKAGHRPPQPVLDMDVENPPANLAVEPDPAQIVDGGLPRHVVADGTLNRSQPVYDEAIRKGGDAAQVIAQRVARQDPGAVEAFAANWASIRIDPVPHSGTADEKRAMSFHEGKLVAPGLTPVAVPTSGQPHERWWAPDTAYRTSWAATLSALQKPRTTPALFFVNDRPRAAGAPFANPCPAGIPQRDYRAAFIQTELTYNKHGWFDPQGRIVILENDIKDVIDPNTRTKLPEPLFFRANSGECIVFKSSNFMPNALNADDFQVYTPTDTIGQHIHLVKFDVTSSDGSANGFNYEDATFSPEEVRERIFAYNRSPHAPGQPARLEPRPHPLFRPGGDIYEAAAGSVDTPIYGPILKKGLCPAQEAGESDHDYEARLNHEHPLCGAQRTVQRWWADPIVNPVTGKDNTLRTVFTHDHLGPSSHQQHGLYAGLVIEPANSVWTTLTTKPERTDWAGVPASGVLACAGAPGTPGRPAFCDKLIGGSNLAAKTALNLLRPGNRLEGPVEPRVPLKLRADGGPTATKVNITAPACIGDSDSNPSQPASGLNRAAPSRDASGQIVCPQDRYTYDTRREFALAIADFGIAYNTALEPINPEPLGDSAIRDTTRVRFGQRHVATALAHPLGISGEDPGSQYFNYRHEPLALRLSEASPNAAIGGWDYRQARARADGTTPCQPGDTDCRGDPANGFSTAVFARKDEDLARNPLPAVVLPQTRALLAGTPAESLLDPVLADVEQWRRNFNCALYSESLVSAGCPAGLQRLEPWRAFGDPATPILPTFERDPVQIRLIQGAQEAQHIFTMNGVKWFRLPGASNGAAINDSGFTNAQPLGISEHFEFDVTVNPVQMPRADYLYFGSSVDQLWDGLWGVMRSYTAPAPGEARTDPQRPPLAALDTRLRVPKTSGNVEELCPAETLQKKDAFRFFGISAVRVCDLHGDCEAPSPTGITYNSRFGITDPQALAYVLDQDPVDCDDRAACESLRTSWSRRPNAEVLAELRGQFVAGRPLTPLVLRAAAGQCLYIGLRNQLPPVLEDGPLPDDAGGPVPLPENRAFYNFLPMITDGFNINQFRMSSTVGLSAPRVAQNPVFGDGSNVGQNSTAATNRERAGSLVPPCTGNRVHDGPLEFNCRGSMIWSLTDFLATAQGANTPVEFGALPLRSFGDPIKHPAHGLVGALVVGPVGSRVCADDRFATRWRNPLTGVIERRETGGPSAEICDAAGKHLYVDHALVMQDAVNARRGDMPVPNLWGAEEPDDYGVKAINYATEPLWARTGGDPSLAFEDRNDQDQSLMLSSAEETVGGVLRCRSGVSPILARTHPCDPETPVMRARPGEVVRLEIVHPGGHTRQQGLALSGHVWNPFPWDKGSHVLNREAGSSIRQGVYNGFGPMMGITLEVPAGGGQARPMDYLFRSQASFLFDGGLWGLLRVQNDETSPTPAR